MAGVSAAGLPARAEQAAAQRSACRTLQVEFTRANGRDSLGIDLDRGCGYRIVAPDAAREEILEGLVATGLAAVVSPGGGLIGNLRVWENLTLPAAWRGRARYAELEPRARSLLAEAGFVAERFSTLCRAMPETLSAFEARAVAFTRAMLLDPEVLVFDRLFEGLAPSESARALRFESLFRLRFPFRTSIFVDAEPQALLRTFSGREIDLREAP